MAELKAVLFDLHGTLVYQENAPNETDISEYLFNRGYEVSSQQLKAAWSFVAFVDYPKHGYDNWNSFLARILWRLKVEVDKKTLGHIVKLLESHPYQLYLDADKAVPEAKKEGFKTAIVTTIARFKFERAIKPIRKYLDFVMTGYEAGCDKSNPKMYKKLLKILRVKPSEAIMIGDDVPLDIVLPKQLGINAILLNRQKKKMQCPQADAIVNNLDEAMETVIRKFSKTR